MQRLFQVILVLQEFRMICCSISLTAATCHLSKQLLRECCDLQNIQKSYPLKNSFDMKVQLMSEGSQGWGKSNQTG